MRASANWHCARQKFMFFMALTSTCSTNDCIEEVRRAVYTFFIVICFSSEALETTVKIFKTSMKQVISVTINC